MRKILKFTLAAALLTCRLATADVVEASASISDIKIGFTGGQWWGQLFKGVSWLPNDPSGASVQLDNPPFTNSVKGWQGDAMNASVADAGSFAEAKLTATTSPDAWNSVKGVSASAKVSVRDGQSGSAYAKVYDGLFQIGGKNAQGEGTTITVTAVLDKLLVSGTSGQANAYIDFCSWEDVCAPASYVEAFVDASFPDYTGPKLLRATWTNTGDAGFKRMVIGLAVSAQSAIPEPATFALCAIGLAGVGFSRRRRA